jgi:hypothetical protein
MCSVPARTLPSSSQFDASYFAADKLALELLGQVSECAILGLKVDVARYGG